MKALRSSTILIALLVLGLVGISQNCSAQMRISGFSDFSFGSWPGSGALTLTDGTLCTYAQGGTGNYRITATSSEGSFSVSSGSDTVPYTVSWKDSQGTSGTFTALDYGSAQSFGGADTSDASCLGSYNAALRIAFSSASLGAGAPGSYSGTLFILLESP